MSRLFTFGCSFTSYSWPTWADIVGQEFDQFQNWGRTGAGNSFIFHSVVECNKRQNLNKHDTVIIMWTGICREDRYTKKRGWITPGSIYNQFEYPQEYVEKFVDYTGCLLRDLSYVSAVRQMLDAIGCTYYFLSMTPFDIYDDGRGWRFDIDSRILDLYHDDFALVRESVYSAVFANDWYSRPGFLNHREVKKQFGAWHREGWPTWEDFVEQKFDGVAVDILRDINEVYQLTNKMKIRIDTHPTPLEHLEYVEKVLPEFDVSSQTKNWVAEVDGLVRSQQSIKKLWKTPYVKRF